MAASIVSGIGWEYLSNELIYENTSIKCLTNAHILNYRFFKTQHAENNKMTRYWNRPGKFRMPGDYIIYGPKRMFLKLWSLNQQHHLGNWIEMHILSTSLQSETLGERCSISFKKPSMAHSSLRTTALLLKMPLPAKHLSHFWKEEIVLIKHP